MRICFREKQKKKKSHNRNNNNKQKRRKKNSKQMKSIVIKPEYKLYGIFFSPLFSLHEITAAA